MTNDTDLARLKATYQAWNDTKGASTDTWLDILSDNVLLRSMGEETPGLSFAKDRNSKQDVVEYFSSMANDWTMIHFTPEIYVKEGDLIAVFGFCAWTNKSTGKNCEVRFSNLVRFDKGEVVEFTEVFDSARAAAAAISVVDIPEL